MQNNRTSGEPILKESVQKMMDRYYPTDSNGIRYLDGTSSFYDWIKSDIPSTATVINVGAGPTPPENRRLRGCFHKYIGTDPDPIVLQNRDLDEAFVNDGVRLPFADEFADAVISDWTIEHVDHPGPFLREILRVLKPGAPYIFRTTNLLHYAMIVSRLTPHSFHRLVANKARGLADTEHEPWPTRYRMNTPWSLDEALRKAGFAEIEVRYWESYPSYLVFHPLFFLLGVAYERTVNSSERLSWLRAAVHVRATKGRELLKDG